MERNPDPWLYFYEDFLAAYDSQLREERGVYYTPVQVVRCQTKLVKGLLVDRFRKPLAFADDDVIFLDPAAGTGTYALGVISEGIELVQERFGAGAVPQRATVLARNVHAFELLVGPYAVAHLRVTQKLQEAGATLPDDGVHVYLTDTLESPDAAPPEINNVGNRMKIRMVAAVSHNFPIASGILASQLRLYAATPTIYMHIY